MALDRLVFQAILIVLLCAAPQARAGDVVTWLLPDFAPAALPVNGQPTQGATDLIALYLSAHWPDSEHRFRFANAKRIWTDLDSDQHVCHAAALITVERKKKAYMTPTNLVLPLQLMVHVDKLAQVPLNRAGEVPLAALFANNALHGVVAEQRSFGEAIDQRIHQRGTGSGLAVVAPGNFGGNLLKMVAQGQIDYTIDYDFSLTYQLSQNRSLRDVRNLPIEGSNALLPVGVACPRTPWGRSAIEKIDHITATREGADAMLAAVLRWTSPAARARYGKELEAYAVKRRQPLNPADF